jgi:transcriptional regulator with XRE-family HTH domain
MLFFLRKEVLSMDLKKTGALIAELRRQKNLTQRELAAQLGVTDKAISRWETGKGFPDVSILDRLANTLGVTITEIVNGERSNPENNTGESDQAVLSALGYARGMLRTLIAVILAIAGVGLLFSPLVVLGVNAMILMVCGALLLIAAALVYFVRITLPERRFRWLSILFLGVSLTFEIIPGSAVLIFASGPGDQFVEYISCFDLTLVGYANAAPFLAAILTALSTILSLLILIGIGQKCTNTAYIITILAAIFMVLPAIFFGISYFPPMALAITFCLVISCWLQACANGAQ